MKMKIVLSLVFALFIGILIVTYVVTRRANPVMLDEYGRVQSDGRSAAHGHN